MNRNFLAMLCLLLAPAVAARAAETPAAPESLYAQHCASCHADPATRSPALSTLQQMPLSRILSALEFGKMQVQAAALSPAERLALGQWLAAAEDARRDAWIAQQACTQPPAALVLDGTQNWGFGAHNARFLRTGVGIDGANIGQLQLAWSLALPQVTDMRSQPVAAGDTLFLGTQTGSLLALDQASGCVHWAFKATGGIRSALALAATPEPTLFFADDLGSVYAVDARRGALRWRADVRLFPVSVVSGSISYHDGRLFVPVSSFEVAAAGMPTHECCRSHGGVIALDAGSGARLWTLAQHARGAAHAQEQRRRATLGPLGRRGLEHADHRRETRAAVRRHRGKTTRRPATPTSDAVIALGLADGEPRWQFQALADDVWKRRLPAGRAELPGRPGPDWDIGASAALAADASGRERLLVGQKSGELFALDPDASGAVLWRHRLSQGTPNGGNSGIHWGMASDGERVFAPVWIGLAAAGLHAAPGRVCAARQRRRAAVGAPGHARLRAGSCRCAACRARRDARELRSGALAVAAMLGILLRPLRGRGAGQRRGLRRGARRQAARAGCRERPGAARVRHGPRAAREQRLRRPRRLHRRRGRAAARPLPVRTFGLRHVPADARQPAARLRTAAEGDNTMSRAILITGASSGIGEALAREFAARGYRLALLARRVGALQELEMALRAAGSPQVVVHALDVGDAAAIEPAIGACAELLGGLDIVVANAGVAHRAAIGRGSLAQLQETIAVDLLGACATIDAAVRHFRARGAGQVVGITSMARYRGLPDFAAYSAAKEGLHRYLQALRIESWHENITVTELAPGYIDTPMNRGSRSRPFLIDAQKGARLMADLIEQRVGYATVPALPWRLLGPLMRLVPARFLARRPR